MAFMDRSLTRQLVRTSRALAASRGSAYIRGALDDCTSRPAPGGYAMLSDIYNKRILALAGNIPRLGRLPAPDGTATAHSRLCGSTVTVDLVLRDGRVADFAHDVKACALGQASSSIMAETIVGSTPDELRALRTGVHAMLKDGAPPPDGRWSAVAVLEPVRDYKARHASTLLTFDAVVSALDQAEAGAARSAAE
jgi:NifU-like protein involved in Fe-S cluster formation